MTASPPRLYVLKPSPYSSHSKLLERVVPTHAGHRLLDVGGGEGYLSSAFLERGFEVTCVAAPGTLSADIPNAVRTLEMDLDFELADLGTFHTIVCGDVIEHVRNPDRLLRWLRGMLEPDGRFVASLPNSGHYYFRGNVLLGRFPQHDRGLFDRTHLHFYTWDGWRSLFERNGFAMESVESTSLPVGLALGLDHLHPVARAGEWMNYSLAKLWKRLFAYQFVVVASLSPDFQNSHVH